MPAGSVSELKPLGSINRGCPPGVSFRRALHFDFSSAGIRPLLPTQACIPIPLCGSSLIYRDCLAIKYRGHAHRLQPARAAKRRETVAQGVSAGNEYELIGGRNLSPFQGFALESILTQG